ncbi:pentapeptide repeat-containing protein [Nonomuraea sp. NPDC046802]|uniref:pentapeptide repeat-containing protein n=1 Tax=Nonomuraea sp. NPDC046802 TaxID=3154919 RepID=UPI0033CA1059
MKPLSIVVTIAVTVLVVAIGWMLGPGAAWWLEHVDGVTGLQGEKLAAAVDAVRGRALAVATGLAALLALYYTARNADTARRTFQLGERGHDTDRYSKAAEQLGHAEAPVRLAGLYALEQLAQNNPALRQRIVDVITAYLRMPYTAPKGDDRNDAGPAVPRAALGGRTAPPGGRDPHEERQVRLAAQRILAAHLHHPAPTEHLRWQRAVSTPVEFWSGIRLDLTGALLIDFDFRDCRVNIASFDRVTFTGVASFLRATFTDRASFVGATFTDNASFADATFRSYASFGKATFTGIALFDRAAFTGTATFGGATFTDVTFGGVTFSGGSYFHQATFEGEARFDAVTFSDRSSFNEAIFRHRALFTQGLPEQGVDLDGAIVAAEAIGAGHTWPPGWQVIAHGEKGGVLRKHVPPTTEAEHEAGPELPA